LLLLLQITHVSSTREGRSAVRSAMGKDDKSTRRKRGKRGGTITDEKEAKPKGKTVEAGSQRSIRRRMKKSKNKEDDTPKERTVTDENKSKREKRGGKGTKRTIASNNENSVMPTEAKPPPPAAEAAAAAPAADVLTHGLTLPEELRTKLYDPERDERSVKGRDPDSPSPEQLKRLQAFVAQCIAAGTKGLIEEFESVKTFNVDLSASTPSHQANPTKNRYRDIFCIEPSRVILKDGKEGDYINANWVRGPPFLNDFICTQGPLEGTMVDFWRMVVQENVGYIVMLCDLIELGKKKCERYIPEKEGASVTYGEYKVSLQKVLVDGHFINSILTVDIPDKQSRIVYHHQWKNWPDRGVPLTALAGLRVLRHARTTKCPTIIHCSAGVGRTGTLVAIEYMLQTIINGDGPYDMREMVKALRNQRAHAIQTAPQYAYVAQAILRKMVMLDASSAEANAKYQLFAAEMKVLSGPPPPPPPPPSEPSTTADGKP
ncbi:hypothetical protein PENTCL1PPCAC_22008, partial [Pristionchus entomophagus]